MKDWHCLESRSLRLIHSSLMSRASGACPWRSSFEVLGFHEPCHRGRSGLKLGSLGPVGNRCRENLKSTRRPPSCLGVTDLSDRVWVWFVSSVVLYLSQEIPLSMSLDSVLQMMLYDRTHSSFWSWPQGAKFLNSICPHFSYIFCLKASCMFVRKSTSFQIKSKNSPPGWCNAQKAAAEHASVLNVCVWVHRSTPHVSAGAGLDWPHVSQMTRLNYITYWQWSALTALNDSVCTTARCIWCQSLWIRW